VIASTTVTTRMSQMSGNRFVNTFVVCVTFVTTFVHYYTCDKSVVTFMVASTFVGSIDRVLTVPELTIWYVYTVLVKTYMGPYAIIIILNGIAVLKSIVLFMLQKYYVCKTCVRVSNSGHMYCVNPSRKATLYNISCMLPYPGNGLKISDHMKSVP
jgi:hypothetical protein